MKRLRTYVGGMTLWLAGCLYMQAVCQHRSGLYVHGLNLGLALIGWVILP